MQQYDSTTSRRSRDRYGLSALLAYFSFSIFFFGRSLIGRFSTAIIGQGCDPGAYVWCLVWLPYAFHHHLNPLFSDLIWAPGESLAWRTFMPLLSLFAWPITAAFGPVAAFNVSCLLAPALAGWTAFILCRYITGRSWPAFAGGYVFGFSPYIAAQMTGHLVLVAVWPIPLAVYLAIRRVNGDIGPSGFTILLALLVAAQFLMELELAATLAFFGGLAMLAAVPLAPADVRRRLYIAILNSGVAAVLAATLLSPYLYYMLAFPVESGPPWPPDIFSADLLNFVIPTPANLVGGFQVFRTISSRFPGNLGETSAYLSPGLITIALAFAFTHWREWTGRLLIAMLAFFCILSMGNLLHIGGVAKFPLPWNLFLYLPLIDKALPVRLTMFTFLILAIMTAVWLSAAPVRSAVRPAIAILAVLLMLPNLKADFWVNRLNLPSFLAAGHERKYLRENDVVLPLPKHPYGDGMLWQAVSGMYFRIAEGYLGPDPQGFEQWQAGDPWQFLEFLAKHNVTAIIISDKRWHEVWAEGPVSWKLAQADRKKSLTEFYQSVLKVDPIKLDDAFIFKVPPDLLAPYREALARP